MSAVRLGMGLRIFPPPLERRFWESSVYKQGAKRVDFWVLGCTLSNNIMMHRFATQYEQYIPHPVGPSLRLGSVLFVCLVFCQLIWSTLAPDHYHRWRRRVVFARRSFALLSFLNAVSAMRTVISDAGPSWQSLTSPEFLLPKTGGSVVRLVLMGTAAMLPMLHGTTCPLPFQSQLLFHLVYLFVTLSLYTAPAQRLLSIPNTSDVATKGVCTSFNLFLLKLEAAILTIPRGDRQAGAACGPEAAPALILLAHLYLGFVVPVYAAYRLEYDFKLTFLIQVLSSQGGHPGAIRNIMDNHLGFPHVADIVFVLLLAPVAWVVSLQLYAVVLRTIVLPLPTPAN